MNRFKKCFNRDHHDWVFENTGSSSLKHSVFSAEGYLRCEICPATTNPFIEEAYISGEPIEDIIAEEDEKILLDIDNQRIEQGLD